MSESGFTNGGPTSAVVVVIVGMVIAARFWAVMPGWAKALAVVAGVLVLGFGLASARGTWPRLPDGAPPPDERAGKDEAP